jgi:hypothetical protein
LRRQIGRERPSHAAGGIDVPGDRQAIRVEDVRNRIGRQMVVQKQLRELFGIERQLEHVAHRTGPNNRHIDADPRSFRHKGDEHVRNDGRLRLENFSDRGGAADRKVGIASIRADGPRPDEGVRKR